MLPYPTRRETERLRAWYHQAGAQYRLTTPIARTAELREATERRLVADSPMTITAADLRQGAVMPEVVRTHRGGHSSYRLFVLDGLGQRVRREGVVPLLALEREIAALTRPATWTLIWLDEPGLLPLIERAAPSLYEAIELAPPLVSDAALGATSDEVARLLTRSLPPSARRADASSDDDALRLALARGDVAEAEALLGSEALPESLRLERLGEAALLAGDARRAHALYLAAVGVAGHPPGAEARLAELWLELGFAAGAEELSRRLLADGDAGAAARAGRVAARILQRRGGDVAEVIRSLSDRLAEASPNDREVLETALADVVDAAGGDEEVATDHRLRALADAGQTQRPAAELALAGAYARAGKANEARSLYGSVVAGGTAAGRAALAARRGLGRLDLESAVSLAARGDTGADVAFAAAAEAFERVRVEARAAGDTAEACEALRDGVALAAARGDLDAVIAGLGAVVALAREKKLRPLLFDALEDHARALRFRRDLQLAKGEVLELEPLAADTSLPDHEARAAAARGEYARDLGLLDEVREAYTAAARIASEVGDAARAAEFEALAAK